MVLFGNNKKVCYQEKSGRMCTPVILACGRWRPELRVQGYPPPHSELEASLGYMKPLKTKKVLHQEGTSSGDAGVPLQAGL